jgi:methyl-accepting chemotaxis protein
MIKMGEHNVGVITEIDESEVFGAVKTLLITLLIVALIIAIIAALIGIFFSKTISTPLVYTVDIAAKVAEGDFTQKIDEKYLDREDEIGSMAKALDKMILGLKNVIINIITSAENLSQAVQQIASGNENLSQRTSEQASSLEEIASTIEESTASIKQNAENANNAENLSGESLVLSNKGTETVDDAVNAINEINESSNKISDIISTINEIAFQTNLLALNAAVEAARAGEQGRGFAVVAGEVRNLAQRSANASKDIEVLIKDSITKITKGTELSNKTGEVLGEVNKSITNVNKIVSEVSAATEEQKQGIDQINVAIVDMDSMTQQNASLVEETASASEEMANMAQDLLELVQAFKVSDDNQNIGTGSKRKVIKTAVTKKAGKTETANKKTTGTSGESEKLDDLMKDDGFEEF